MSSPIERLPGELLDIIVASFSLRDFQNIRLVSHRLNHVTHSSFCTRYLKHRTTTLASHSLDRLLNISACADIASHVSRLVVKVLCFEEIFLLRAVTRVGIYPPPKRFPRITFVPKEDIASEAALWDQLSVEKSSKDIMNKLSRALRRFTNLQAVRLYVNDRVPVGIPQYESKSTGSYEYFVMASFSILVSALIQSHVKIEHFTIRGQTLRLSQCQVQSAEPSTLIPNHAVGKNLHDEKVFEKLKKLRLKLGFCFFPEADRKMRPEDIIGSAPALEELDLVLSRPLGKAQKAASMCLVMQAELPKLKTLTVRGGVFDVEQLNKFVKKHVETLREVHMGHCVATKNTWTSFIQSLGELHLEYIRLHKLSPGPRSRFVEWVMPDGNLKALTILDTRNAQEERPMADMLAVCISQIHPVT